MRMEVSFADTNLGMLIEIVYDGVYIVYHLCGAEIRFTCLRRVW